LKFSYYGNYRQIFGAIRLFAKTEYFQQKELDNTKRNYQFVLRA